MSGRYNESLIFAYDKEGEWCLVEQGYSYSGGCGDYHNRVEIKDKFYDVYVNVNCDPGDEYEEVTGTYLPYTCVADYASYFSSAPTNTIQTVLQEAELTDMNFSRFLIIDIYGTASVMFNVECILISEEGVSRKEHNFARKTFSDDLGDVVETLLSIYDPKTNNNKRSNPVTGLDRKEGGPILSGRYTNKVIFAYDASGNRYLVTQEYFYASGSGCYHERIDINDKFYDLEGYVDDEEMTKKGTYLPHTYVADCGSYFTQAPTETIQTVLCEAELTEIEITSFLTIVLLSVNAGVYEAVGHRITPEGVTEIEFDIQNADYSHDIDLTLNIVLTMAELENQ